MHYLDMRTIVAQVMELLQYVNICPFIYYSCYLAVQASSVCMQKFTAINTL